MTSPVPPLTTHLAGTPAAVEAAVTEALAAQGFGVLTRIDVAATMKARLDEELEEYLILGACNPPLAFRALQSTRQVGLLLPCNVVLRAEAGGTRVEAIDPAALLPGDDPAMTALAEEARGRLAAALESLAAG